MQNDKEIEVPDFKTQEDFTNWVENLSDKEIQSWRAKDWNKMYDKLFQYIENSPEIEAEIPKLLKSGKYFKRKDLTIKDLKTEDLAIVKRAIFKRMFEYDIAMSKLYKNYQIEPTQFNIICELARKAGEEAATTGEINTAFISIRPAFLSNAAERIEKIVYNQTSYSEELKKQGMNEERLRAEIKREESSILDFTLGGTVDAHSIPFIHIKENEVYEDMPLAAIFHEAAHAHLQVFKYGLVEELRKVKPVKNFDEDFVQLLTNNEKLYLNPEENIASNIDEMLTTAITTGKLSEEDKIKLGQCLLSKNYKGIVSIINRITKGFKVVLPKSYRRQPIEYFADLYGLMAERSFRRASSQYSERYLEETTKHLQQIWTRFNEGAIYSLSNKLMQEQEFYAGNINGMRTFLCRDKKGNIGCFIRCWTEENMKQKKECLKYLFSGKDNPLDGKIKIIEVDKDIQILTPPGGASMQKAWQEWAEKIWQPYETKCKMISPFLHQIDPDTKILSERNMRMMFDENENIRYMPDENADIRIIPDENGNMRIRLSKPMDDQYYEYLFKGTDNPLNGKIKKETDTVLIINSRDLDKDLKKWQQKIWNPIQRKIETLAKAFTSKNEFHIVMEEDGCAKIEFNKELPYSKNEINDKIADRIKNIKNLDIRLQSILLSSMHIGGVQDKDDRTRIKLPPVHKKEFNLLLKLFQKDKIGFIETEQKRDAIKRWRRVKKARMINKIKGIIR